MNQINNFQNVTLEKKYHLQCTKMKNFDNGHIIEANYYFLNLFIKYFK